MANFWTDLNRMLDRAEQAEREDHAMREAYGDNYRDLEAGREAARYVSEDDVS